MRSDIKELGDIELLRKHKIVKEYLVLITREINSRKLPMQEVKSNFPQHLSSEEASNDNVKTGGGIKITVKEKEVEKTSDNKNDKNNTKLEDLTKNDLKLVLDENKISYKTNDKKEELIELIRKNHLVRLAIKYKNSSK